MSLAVNMMEIEWDGIFQGSETTGGFSISVNERYNVINLMLGLEPLIYFLRFRFQI